MGHVNNASYLTFAEIARLAYYEHVTGEPLPLATHGAQEGMILAEIRITYRNPAFYGEILSVETRVDRIGRTSFAMVHRLTAPASRYGPARLIAVADSVLVMYDYQDENADPGPGRGSLESIEAFEGRRASRLIEVGATASAVPAQASKRRKIATAFCPPNPKPLIIAVSTRSWRFTFGV